MLREILCVATLAGSCCASVPSESAVSHDGSRTATKIGATSLGGPDSSAADGTALLERTGFSGRGEAIYIDNTALGGTLAQDFVAGHLIFEYRDADGVRGAGQFSDSPFETFCIDIQVTRNGVHEYQLVGITEAPVPAGFEFVPPYDADDERELNAVMAAAIRLGWLNGDLSSTPDLTNTRRAAIQGQIWRVLFDGLVVEPNFPAIANNMSALAAEAALQPDAVVPGLSAFSSETTQDVLVIADPTPPDLFCVLDVVPPDPCDCDYDGDGDSDVRDLALFLEQFASGNADFNGDGTTDVQDLIDFTACNTNPPAECAPPGPADDACVDGFGEETKLETVVLQYTGEGCGTSMNSQDPGKFECSGDPMGDPEVYIVSTDSDNPDDNDPDVYFAGNVILGDVAVISASNAGQDRLRSATFVYIYADDSRTTLLQSVEFHTSCSQPLFSGDTFGALRLIDAIDDNGNPTIQNTSGGDGSNVQTLQVNITSSDPSADIEAMIVTECGEVSVENGQIIDMICFQPGTQSSGDICENGLSKPSEITLRYTGEDCSATITSQDDDKYFCEGDPMFDDSVYIVITRESNVGDLGPDSETYFADTVALNEAFDVSASAIGREEFHSQTFGYIFSDESQSELLQSIEFHTSCSQPIGIGDQYGSVQILSVTDKDGNTAGGDILECGFEVIDGRLTITASFATLVATATDAAGNTVVCETLICEPDPIPDDCCDAGDRPDSLVLRYTGEDCSATVTQQDEGKYGCTGDPMFDDSVYIIASDDENPADDGADVYFAGEVALNEDFTISAFLAGEDRFSSATFVHVFSDSSQATLLQSVEFHTSCSQPLFTGDQYGSIAIIACDDPNEPESCCDDGNKPNAYVLTYTGEDCSATVTYQDEDKYACFGDPAFAGEVHIVSTDEEDPYETDANVYFAGDVALGGQFVISSLNAGRDNFGSRTYVHVFADDSRTTLLQSVEFHTSCSQPVFLGDQYGSIRIDACEDPNAPVVCCADGSKPNELDMLYTGADCASSSTTQDDGKWNCTGETLAAPKVVVFATDDENPDASGARIYFSGSVLLGDFFTMTAANAGEDKFSSETFVHIFDLGGDLLQSIEFHTSCSQPLNIGDSFGSVEILDCRSN